ncbi:MAG: beta-lactamase family protein [Kiritimatiellae bacterium]|nr:beta-lactamase family protein [Kiritimatiellia bacterium]
MSASESLLGSVEKYCGVFPDETELAIALIEGDAETHAGFRKRDGVLVPKENRATIFDLGSISKTFTVTMLAQYLASGRLKLDTPVKDLLPMRLKQSSRDGVEITLLHLCNHTAGLPNAPANFVWDPDVPGGPYRTYGEKEFHTYLTEQLALKSTPGARYQYSGVDFSLLGLILSLQAQKGFEDLLKELVCAPLGLPDTTVTLSAEQKSRYADGRGAEGQPIVSWAFNIHDPAAGVRSNAADLVTYVRANLSESLHCGLTHESTFEIDAEYGIGLGWLIFRGRGRQTHVHYGGCLGYTAAVMFEKRTQSGLVVLSNIEGRYPQVKAAFKTMCSELRGFADCPILKP